MKIRKILTKCLSTKMYVFMNHSKSKIDEKQKKISIKQKQQINEYLRIVLFVTFIISILKKMLIQRSITLQNSKTFNFDCIENFEIVFVFTIEKMKFVKYDKYFKN